MQYCLTGSSTDCMRRSQGALRALGLVANQYAVAAVNAPMPRRVFVERLRKQSLTSDSSGIRICFNSSCACMTTANSICRGQQRLNQTLLHLYHGTEKNTFDITIFMYHGMARNFKRQKKISRADVVCSLFVLVFVSVF